jgi:hypothetical protein
MLQVPADTTSTMGSYGVKPAPAARNDHGFEALMLQSYLQSQESGKPFYFCNAHKKVFNDVDVGGIKLLAVDSYYSHMKAHYQEAKHGMEGASTPGVQ